VKLSAKVFTTFAGKIGKTLVLSGEHMNSSGSLSQRSFHALLLMAFSCASIFVPTFAQGTASPTPNVISRAGDNVLTTEDMEDLRILDASVLDTPLSPEEQQQARQNIVNQFQKNSAAFTKARPATHQLAEMMRHGSLSERTEISMRLWANWNARSETDPATRWWVAMVRRHNPPILQNGDLVITRIQINGLFADDDWVAQTAGLSPSTEASRAAYVRELPAKFAAMPQEEKMKLARADVRWFDLHDPVLDHNDLRQIAVNQVHERVHGQQDVYSEARNLEDVGVRFNTEMAQFAHNMAAIGNMDFKTKSNINNLNFANRLFQGKGP
jgi:hypothetical protein